MAAILFAKMISYAMRAPAFRKAAGLFAGFCPNPLIGSIFPCFKNFFASYCFPTPYKGEKKV